MKIRPMTDVRPVTFVRDKYWPDTLKFVGIQWPLGGEKFWWYRLAVKHFFGGESWKFA